LHVTRWAVAEVFDSQRKIASGVPGESSRHFGVVSRIRRAHYNFVRQDIGPARGFEGLSRQPHVVDANYEREDGHEDRDDLCNELRVLVTLLGPGALLLGLYLTSRALRNLYAGRYVEFAILLLAVVGCVHVGVGFLLFGNPLCGAGWGNP
jgi:hypothetical protein